MNEKVYQKRILAFKKAKADWASRPDRETCVPDKLLTTGYTLAHAEKDPLVRQALRDWLNDPKLPH